MSEHVPTVKVKMKGDKSKQTYTINLTDFDEKKHEMAKGDEVPALKPLDPAKQEMLFGSSKQPSDWKLPTGKVLQLGTVVAEAHKRSGLTVEEWNAQPQDTIEEKIAEVVAEMVPPAPAFKVGKRGRGNAAKFFIFDTEGKQVGEEEYDTEDAANEALKNLSA